MATCTREITENDFQREVLEHDGDVLVDFYTEWCPPCRAMAPVLDEVCQARGSLKVVKIDAEENADLAVRHEVRVVPTFVLYRRGRVVGTTTGLVAASQFNQWIEQSLA